MSEFAGNPYAYLLKAWKLLDKIRKQSKEQSNVQRED